MQKKPLENELKVVGKNLENLKNKGNQYPAKNQFSWLFWELEVSKINIFFARLVSKNDIFFLLKSQ